jgi:hypothetical protein
MTFTANYVVEIPTGVRWFRPYFLGGGGLGNLSRRIAETGLVLDAGGGIDFPIVHGLAVGGDVRYFHLNAGGIDAARVGARVSYRF